MLPMLLLIFIIAAISPKLHRKHQHHAASPFLDHELNNTQVVISRASNEGSRRFHNHGEGPYWCILLVESTY